MATKLVDHLPGQVVPVAGVYGAYFLGSYVSMKVLGAGEEFPEHSPGVTYRLHEAFV